MTQHTVLTLCEPSVSLWNWHWHCHMTETVVRRLCKERLVDDWRVEKESKRQGSGGWWFREQHKKREEQEQEINDQDQRQAHPWYTRVNVQWSNLYFQCICTMMLILEHCMCISSRHCGLPGSFYVQSLLAPFATGITSILQKAQC